LRNGSYEPRRFIEIDIGAADGEAIGWERFAQHSAWPEESFTNRVFRNMGIEPTSQASNKANLKVWSSSI